MAPRKAAASAREKSVADKHASATVDDGVQNPASGTRMVTQSAK
jgi:hypothetical protein